MKHVIIFIVSTILFSCTSKKENIKVSQTKDTLGYGIRYAKGFTVTYDGKIKRVNVNSPFQGATSGYTYLLVPKGEEVPEHDASVKIIRTPVESIVCTSTTHIPLLDYLDVTDKLVGFPTTDYISSEKARALIDAGKVQELGIDKGINLERLAVLKPDMVMGYTMTGDYGQFKKMEELGASVVLNSEYLERHPLGRAEWIKFVALFFDKERVADSVFNEIEKRYLSIKELAAKVDQKPTILSGVVYGDAWFMPGGQNYAARLLDDAGCHYLWNDDSTSGFLELSFESVYAKANNADRWIGVGSYNSLDEIKAADHRYAQFKPFKDKEVYTFNARVGAKGGSEFLELGYLRPDIILKDLLRIAHPEVLPDHQLFFHKKLE
jgi:iron complex transport system substrate-binding protein